MESGRGARTSEKSEGPVTILTKSQPCSVNNRIEVPRVAYEKLSDERMGESAAAIRKRVEAARERQRARFKGTRLLANADAP